jgi:hypothetical protein
MSSIKLSLSLEVSGRQVPLVVSGREDSSPNAPAVQQFELAAGALRELIFDDVIDGDSITFLLISAVLNATPTTIAAVSYCFDDSSSGTPSDFASWKVVNGIGGGLWTTDDLSTANKMYIYNHGAARIDVTVVIDTEGS